MRATTAIAAAAVALQHPTADTICRQCNTAHMAGDARSRQVGMIPRATSKAAAVRVRCLISTGMYIGHLGGDRSAALVGQIFIFRTTTSRARLQVLDGVGEGSGRRLGCDDKRSPIAAPIDAEIDRPRSRRFHLQPWRAMCREPSLSVVYIASQSSARKSRNGLKSAETQRTEEC